MAEEVRSAAELYDSIFDGFDAWLEDAVRDDLMSPGASSEARKEAYRLVARAIRELSNDMDVWAKDHGQQIPRMMREYAEALDGGE